MTVEKDSGLFPFPNFGALRKNNFFFAWRASAYFLPISLVPHSFLFEEDDWNPSGKHEDTSLCLFCDICSLSQFKSMHFLFTEAAAVTITARESVKLKYDQEGLSFKTTKKHDLWSEEEWLAGLCTRILTATKTGSDLWSSSSHIAGAKYCSKTDFQSKREPCDATSHPDTTPEQWHKHCSWRQRDTAGRGIRNLCF